MDGNDGVDREKRERNKFGQDEQDRAGMDSKRRDRCEAVIDRLYREVSSPITRIGSRMVVAVRNVSCKMPGLSRTSGNVRKPVLELRR